MKDKTINTEITIGENKPKDVKVMFFGKELCKESEWNDFLNVVKEKSKEIKVLQKAYKNAIDYFKAIIAIHSIQVYVNDIEEYFIEQAKEEVEDEYHEIQKPQHEFKVGDRVQFKSWEEMEKEFGVNEDENIDIYPSFINEMRHLCGTFATIEKLDGARVALKEFSTNGETNWRYLVDMFKPATDEPKFKVGDKVRYKAKNVVANQYQSIVYKDEIEPYTEPRWTFTDDEKVILRNLPEGYKWIARDKGSRLWVCSNKPHKEQESWANGVFWENLTVFYNLFQSIKWEDDEACEFRKYL